MNKTLMGMGGAVILLSFLALQRGGLGLLLQGLERGGLMALKVLPLLVVAMLVAGLIPVLVKQESVSKWLGREAGLKGLLLGGLAGALVPGGPYVYFPLAATLMLSGAEIGTVIAFVTAKNLWTLSRLPMEVALLGPKITVIRYVLTFVFPIVLGLWANVLYSRATGWVRKGIEELEGRP
jgi:uncharacterized membrane protein YraQ (UPF0718 family)